MRRAVYLTAILLLTLTGARAADTPVRVDPGVLAELDRSSLTTVIVVFDHDRGDHADLTRSLGLAPGIRVMRVAEHHPEISARISRYGLRRLLRQQEVRAVLRPVELTPAMYTGNDPENTGLASAGR